ncbi:general secretion pathway protein GspK [Sphingomonas canadensis]|uniref:Type II secretion system protein K n=1 Tax=Sphingomonas canadensis TaxID=1219257 RepID=A0ABW3H549_9SPHN|nr:type II secretion system protein GspK [Sphingomonas canadensis]MCW3835753.1 type II secretion system protein GspK [Sphingomonas canadensis]
MRAPRDDEQGMILINVLMFVAIASGLVLLLITREELALDRGLRMREAARALAVARGGELSAEVALRRDLEQAPGQDHAREPWAELSERGAAIEGGTFDLAIADAEGRFNVNSLRSGEAGALVLFQTMAREVGIDDKDIEAIIAFVRLKGPVTDLRPLRLLGLDPVVLARIEPLVTALPGNTSVNLNAADEAMLAILFRDPAVARRLAALRARQGFLTAKDLTDANVTIPWGTSFRSTTFWVRTRATIGGTSQQLATLIRRGFDGDGRPLALPVARWRNAAIPREAPDYPAKR